MTVPRVSCPECGALLIPSERHHCPERRIVAHNKVAWCTDLWPECGNAGPCTDCQQNEVAR